jgi:hypothetical protein
MTCKRKRERKRQRDQQRWAKRVKWQWTQGLSTLDDRCHWWCRCNRSRAHQSRAVVPAGNVPVAAPQGIHTGPENAFPGSATARFSCFEAGSPVATCKMADSENDVAHRASLQWQIPLYYCYSNSIFASSGRLWGMSRRQGVSYLTMSTKLAGVQWAMADWEDDCDVLEVV